jgi:hypothetical protein
LPGALAWRLRLNGALFVGVVWLALSSVGLIWALRHSPLPGEWYLLRDRREAPGWLMGVHQHQSKDRHNATHISYSYHYEFQLPDGRRLTGESSSSNQIHPPPPHPNPQGPADVTVEYHPEYVEANRLKGTHATSGGPFVLFGLLFPAIGLLITGVGLGLAWKTNRLLRLGLPSEGYIQTCRRPTQRSRGSAHMGDASVSWSSSSQQPEYPVAEFRNMIWAQQQANLETARRMQNNKFARGCGWTLAFLFALFFGGSFMAVLLVLVAVGGMALLGFPPEKILPVGLTVGGVGVVLGAFLLMRLIIRKERQRFAPENANARPAEFNRVECTLTFWLTDGVNSGQTNRTLSLKGDEEDEQPRPLLYDPRKPSRTLFVSEFGLPLQIDDEGRWLNTRSWPILRLALVVLALGVAVAGWFLI